MQIPGFQNLIQIHRGDRTSVFRALRESDQASVILKLSASEFPTQSQVAELRHEHEIGTLLSAIPGVVRYIDVVPFGNNTALIIEDIGGISLREFWASADRKVASAIRIVHRIAQTLGFIHEKGVIHKDINPSNIVIDPNGKTLRIIDFELATTLPREAQHLESAETLRGTLDYISPEQTGRMNCPLDSRTDLYSLGVLFYELLAGFLPFQTEDKNELVHHHIAKVPEPPLKPTTPIARALSVVVLKLMAKSPEKRYKSAQGLCADLQRIVDSANDASALNDFSPGQEDFSNRLLIPAKIYGREQEIAYLHEAYASVTHGNKELVLVTGAAGIGKSALIQEIHKPIAATRAYFVSGKFDQFGRTAPYSAFLQAFSQLIRRVVSESPDRVQLWRTRILDMAGESAAVLCDLMPELVWLIGEQPPAPPMAPQESQSRFLHVLSGFVGVFSSAQNPLVVFIDDLQWADTASLGLLERILGETEIHGLMIIGAYRDQEVDSAHPLKLMLARLEKDFGPAKEISLMPLDRDALDEMVADTFSLPIEEVLALSQTLADKTGGNPFFFTQMIRHLYEKGLTSFNATIRSWQWNLEDVAKLKVSENVVDFMTAKIQTLPPDTSRLLSIAACIGPHFSLNTLAAAADVLPTAVAGLLEVALKEEFVIPTDSEYRLAKESGEIDPTYGFLHDRIQQAAAQLVSDLERSRIHLKIGRLLLHRAEQENNVNEQIFTLIDHLVLASPLIESETERVTLAGLTLQAGQKAKNSAAFEAARDYFEHGLAILSALDPWNTNYHTSFPLQLELAECCAFLGEKEKSLALFGDCLAHAQDKQDKALVHEALIHFHTNNSQFAEAYKVARNALKLFEVSLPASFVPPIFVKDLIQCRVLFKGRKIEELINLPECSDPERLTAMRLLAAVLKACYQIRPELCVANAFKLINMALQFGIMRDLAVALMAAGGIFLGSIIGRHSVGWEFGNLSLAVIEKYRNEKQRAEVNFIYGYFVHFWKRPAIDAEVFFRKSYDSALQTGDHFHLACSACTLVESGWIRGVPFDELNSLAQAYNVQLKKIDSREALGAVQAVTSAIANLKGETSNSISYNREGFQEEEFVKEIATYNSLHFSHFYFINKMQTLYLWGEYDLAWKVSQESKTYLKYSVGMLHTAEHFFYRGLILGSFTGLARSRRLRELKAIVSRLQKWALDSPENFEHKALLIEAELTRLEGKVWQALKLYQSAITSAEKNTFLQNKALSEELCARFLLGNGHMELGNKMLRTAYFGYTNWGASAKAEAMLAQYPQFTLLQTRSENRSTTKKGPTNAPTGTTTVDLELDIGSILKATQAISGEIHLETLLGRLISIIIESAGAQKGYILVPENQSYVVEAAGRVGSEPVVMQRNSIASQRDISASVLRYVNRTKENLVLDNAAESTMFVEELDSPLTKTSSLLCAPILHQDRVIALIYLVNNLSKGAFTPSRLKVLQMLSAQAAISIENARHYEQLEEKVEERTRDLRSARENSDRLLLNILPVSIADELKAHGHVVPKLHQHVTVLFTDFSQFTALASNMTPLELVATLGDFFSAFDDICVRFGLEKLKTIGDAYMAVGGLPIENHTHAIDACLAGLAMLRYVETKKITGEGWNLRVGLHTGEAIAGVIGKNKFVYDIWGDTVNVASRMESGGTPGRMNVSGEIWNQVAEFFDGESRGFLQAKNRGELAMHYLLRLKEPHTVDPLGQEPKPEFMQFLERWRETGQRPTS